MPSEAASRSYTRGSALRPNSPMTQPWPLRCCHCNLWPQESTGKLFPLFPLGARALRAHTRVQVCCQGSSGKIVSPGRFFVSLPRRGCLARPLLVEGRCRRLPGPPAPRRARPGSAWGSPAPAAGTRVPLRPPLPDCSLHPCAEAPAPRGSSQTKLSLSRVLPT